MNMDNEVVVLLEDIRVWAAIRADIFGILLVGSHLHGTANADSDIDVVVITKNTAAYLHDHGWVEAFGQTQQINMEDHGKVTSLRTFYQSGMEIEFAITDSKWLQTPIDAGTARVLRDGYKIIYERNHWVTDSLKDFR